MLLVTMTSSYTIFTNLQYKGIYEINLKKEGISYFIILIYKKYNKNNCNKLNWSRK